MNVDNLTLPVKQASSYLL